MTQDSGAHDNDPRSDATTHQVSPLDPAAEASPFLLIPESDDGPRTTGPSTDVLGRIARILAAAESDPELDDPVRVSTGAWLSDDGWQVGIGVLRAPDGHVAVSALAVADRGQVEAWRKAANGADSSSLSALLAASEIAMTPGGLPKQLADLAAQAELKRCDRFPIEAGDQVVGVILLLCAEERPPSAPARQAMDMSSEILCQVARRVRAHTAVTGAARHIRELSKPSDDTGTQPGPADPDVGEFEERFELVCRGAEAGLWDWNLDRDEIHYSSRWKATLGYGAAELGTQPSEWFDRIHPDDADRVELELLEHLDQHSPRFETEHRVLHGDGCYRWVRVRAVAKRGESGKATRIAGSMVDISDSRTRTDRTARDLMYNRLTGCPTAALLVDRIEQAMRRRVRRPDRSFAVLALSHDGLPEASERLGIEATEEMLLTLGRRIANAIRPGDTVAHLDDLKFGIVLDEVKSLDDALRVSNRVVQALAPPIPLGSETLKLAPAVGLALSRTAYEAPGEMLRDAGIALRRARREGVQVQVFDAATKAFAQSVVELEGDLRKAFEARELFLEYQPVVSLSDGRITGVEALLRWNHPERGAISPSEFIPVAQEAGLLPELGYWVVDRACRQMKEWIETLRLQFPPTIAINVHESQLFDESFVARSIEAIESSGLEPRFVRLDVSEGAFMKDGAAAGRILKTLSEHGLRIAVDDFGTGYSSLSYLHRYPIGALKIDRSFVSGSAGEKNDWDVARTIVELARILELEVIAEGIENREQFQRLRALGCQQAQGFFFSGPVGASRAGRLIESGYPLDLAEKEK